MEDDLLTHAQVTELRRQALSRLIEIHGQAEVARRMKRLPQQINDMAKAKSFGEKVALEFERAWRENSSGETIDLIAPRPRGTSGRGPVGWDSLGEIDRQKVEAYISGLLARTTISVPAARQDEDRPAGD
ncbi:hypothetical protein [Burkholderia cenocepacia]|uniref:hypothetical protein n=1 Tax=Burkholderia cenocepacia TaxID=95486 RepID=UPI00097C02D9|nr:hypothetical protein [Burkholderia cenocepacia]ONJ26511.1 hypothetical protein A8D82_00435 [Burkholderia cenocepacia]ONN83862.1 hypothetical protein A8D63_25270 [Burkholderia cenocepacia]ONN87074.1 hypothetical protein A8D64_16545 [Burkholderia cenocepacia]ONN89339.1 hypothetical protein A8D62_19405 [Burkholderia cenocepacia]ONO03498.1 hypothetical protein A8D70_31960 [Burkholderia cenocepacia]